MIPASHKRLRECHSVVTEGFQRIGVPIKGSCSVWVDLREFVRPLDFQNEKSLGNKLIDQGVYINPGYLFNCIEPSWFRIVIATDLEILKLGK